MKGWTASSEESFVTHSLTLNLNHRHILRQQRPSTNRTGKKWISRPQEQRGGTQRSTTEGCSSEKYIYISSGDPPVHVGSITAVVTRVRECQWQPAPRASLVWASYRRRRRRRRILSERSPERFPRFPGGRKHRQYHCRHLAVSPRPPFSSPFRC